MTSPATFLRALVLALPLLCVSALVYRYGVDVPYQDQWLGEAELFEKMEAGTLCVSDFFVQHNEHRIFFPRLIFYAVDNLTHWNVRAEMLVIQLLAVVVAFNVWRTLRITGWTLSGAGFWLFLAANVLIFSPVHYENFLFGFQIGFLLPVACVTGCLWIASATRPPVNFIATMAVCTICTFSIANGFFCWVLTFPLLLHACGATPWKNHKAWLVIWLAAFVANVDLFFYGYTLPEGGSDPWAVVDHPILAVEYALVYLGLPFGWSALFDPFVVAPLAALVMLAVLGSCLLYLWRRRGDATLIARCLPWLVMIAAALIDAITTTVGRLGFGLPALASRYAIFSILLPIGLLFLVAAVYQDLRAQSGRSANKIALGLSLLASIYVVLYALGVGAILPKWNEWNHGRLAAKAMIENINIVDDPELLWRYQNTPVGPIKPRANVLDRIHFLHPGLIKSNRIADIADLTQQGEFGEIEKAGNTAEGNFGASGWAVLPMKRRVADVVLLTYENAKGDPIIFAIAAVGQARPEVAAKLHEDSSFLVGWGKIYSPDKIPPDARTVKAWAFDAETARAYPLRGEIHVAR